MALLRVSESFVSIQGEGLLSGVPSVFLRLSGCNLRCVWCDTPYASWTPEGPLRTVEEIAQLVADSGMSHLVLTGGEPMIFHQIQPLLERVHEQKLHITIETAGTRFQKVKCDLMSISPKLRNSTPLGTRWEGVHEQRRKCIQTLSQLVSEYPVQLKFVIGDQVEADVAEIEQLLSQIPPVPADRILLMPEGVAVEELDRRSKSLVPVCLGRGWRLCPRIHIQLFGNRKGT